MRRIPQAIALALLMSLALGAVGAAHAARHRGASLDGKVFRAVAYSYKSHRRWEGEVTFHGTDATFATRGYGSVTLVLADELIEDLGHIEATDELSGTRWELSVTLPR